MCYFVDLENLSYMKQTHLSSPSTSGGSDKAVDGRYSSRGLTGQQCTISKPDTAITCWVNLGKIYRIAHILVYYRKESIDWDSINCTLRQNALYDISNISFTVRPHRHQNVQDTHLSPQLKSYKEKCINWPSIDLR